MTPRPIAGALEELKAEGCDIFLIAGASAIVDRHDVVPAGIEQAGGKVNHFGMPVDPGNLLLTGQLDGKPVLGLPGCAKSPKYNGFDMVLERLAAGLPVGRAEIVRMGAGGLLAEIPSRPQPRDDSEAGEGEGPQQAPRVAVLVLAAGRSTRMGGPNKLLAEADGQPLVVHAVKAALASQAVEVVVVLGHMADEVRAAIERAVPARVAPALRHQSRFRRGPQHLRARRHRGARARTSTPRSSSSATCRASTRRCSTG